MRKSSFLFFSFFLNLMFTYKTAFFVTIIHAARQCPNNMIYRQCGPSCKPTCGHSLGIYLRDECSMCCPGCHCEDGLVLFNGTCIQPTQCPCSYKDQAYEYGHTLYIEEACEIWQALEDVKKKKLIEEKCFEVHISQFGKKMYQSMKVIIPITNVPNHGLNSVECLGLSVLFNPQEHTGSSQTRLKYFFF